MANQKLCHQYALKDHDEVEKTHYFNCWPWLVSLYGIPSNMINNTYKDWFCVDTSVQNDIYRLSGPIVGIWAPQSPVFCPKLFGENLDRLDMPSPQKMPQHEYIFWWWHEERRIENMIFCRNDFSTQQFPSVVESSVSEVKSFLFYGRPISWITVLPAQMAPVITPASPFPKIDHLIL